MNLVSLMRLESTNHSLLEITKLFLLLDWEFQKWYLLEFLSLYVIKKEIICRRSQFFLWGHMHNWLMFYMIWKFLFCTFRQNYHTFLLLCPIFLSFKLFIVIFIKAFHIKSNIHYLNIFKYLCISMACVCVILVCRYVHQMKVCRMLSSEEVPRTPGTGFIGCS